MTMASKQQATKLARRYPFAVACVGLGLVGLIALVFRFGALSEATTLRDERDAEDKKIAKNVTNSVGIEGNLATLTSDISRLEKMLITVDDVSANQAFFFGLETASGVRMSTMRSTGSPKGVPPTAKYLPAGYNVVVGGSYGQVIGFLRLLESGAHLYRLDNFEIQRASQEGGSAQSASGDVVLTLNLQLLAAK